LKTLKTSGRNGGRKMARGSASKIGRVRRCRHAFYYSDILELQRVAKSIAPARGNLIHDCLQAHYNGGDWTKPIVNLQLDLDKVFDEERAEWAEMPKELYRIVRGYLLAYKSIDVNIKTLATEVPFEIQLPNGHTYTGYIDWIYEDDRGVWVADHKTVKTLPKETELYMDLQTFMYFEACRTDPNLIKLLQGKKLMGVVFNHIRTKAPREPQVLKNGGISKAACDTDIATYFETVRRNGLNVEDYAEMVDKLKGNVFFRRTKIPVNEKTLYTIKDEIVETLDEIDRLKDKHDRLGDCIKPMFYRTPLKQRCDWDCEYRDLCYAELAGMNTENIIAEHYEKRTTREEEQANAE
jgi:DNA-binding ferritin-like protein (Dps family)